MRRSYFNRLLIKGRTALTSSSPKKIAPYFRIQRSDIFNEEVLEIMNSGLEEDIADLWHRFFKLDKYNSKENFLDVLAISNRLPNLFGLEVSRLDHLVMNYMPFAQPSLLSAVLETNLNQRKNSHYSKTLIKENKYLLSKYSLVKDNDVYPFALSHVVLARIWREIRHLLGLSYQGRLKIQILNNLETFIRDTASSNDTRLFGAYDMQKIDNQIAKFYAGEYQYADGLSWWLSFELWRQECSLSHL